MAGSKAVAPGIRRIVARNPSPFTFRGTGTYVVGEGEVAVIDPGPDLDEHVAALLDGLAGERVTHILVTHTHRDHSPAAKPLKAATGAPTYGFGPHAGGRRGEPGIEEGGDWDFTPDVRVADGDAIAGARLAFRGGAHPGPHLEPSVLCPARAGRPVQRRPCDGLVDQRHRAARWRYGAYMASLDKLLGRARRGSIGRPMARRSPSRRPHVRAFIAHRREREAGILDCLAAGAGRIDAIVDRLYAGLQPGLRRAAGRSVHAHLIDLAGRGLVASDGPPTIDAIYRATRS